MSVWRWLWIMTAVAFGSLLGGVIYDFVGTGAIGLLVTAAAVWGTLDMLYEFGPLKAWHEFLLRREVDR